ncbi:MAG: XamI family restriction endonuclease [Acidobacteria bacterium]|nr:XamI family restriction endonuclease [Acidobacteriota bacterium]
MIDPPIDPPRWTSAQLDEARQLSIDRFREERLDEPLEMYLEIFDEYQGHLDDLLESTVDLTDLEQSALDILSDKDLLWAFRFLAGPPISADDLKTLAEASLAPTRLRRDPEMVRRILEVVRMGLDRRRFPWIAEGREPSEAERQAAVLASAALIATSRTQASRRNREKTAQEDTVKNTLAPDLREVPARTINTLDDAPEVGQFCGESLLSNRKADIVVRLWDRRILAIECKVSNSAVNSIKRLKNDAAAKAEAWKKDLGDRHIVPAAVLSGVYDLHILEDAQARGLSLFWAHALAELTDWIASTKTS